MDTHTATIEKILEGYQPVLVLPQEPIMTKVIRFIGDKADDIYTKFPICGLNKVGNFIDGNTNPDSKYDYLGREKLSKETKKSSQN